MRHDLKSGRHQAALAVHLLLLLAWLLSQHAGFVHALVHPRAEQGWHLPQSLSKSLSKSQDGVEQHDSIHSLGVVHAVPSEEHSCLLADAAALAVAATIPALGFLPVALVYSAPVPFAPSVPALSEIHGVLPRGPPIHPLITA